MIEEEAIVASVVDGQVWVEKKRKSACSACTQRCTTGVVDDFFGGKTIKIKVISEIDLKIGDRVMVGIREGAIVGGALWVYIIPLLGLLLGAVAGSVAAPFFSLLPADGVSAIGGGLGLILTLIFLRRARVLNRHEMQPVVIRKLG